jgi:hypothetical protein
MTSVYLSLIDNFKVEWMEVFDGTLQFNNNKNCCVFMAMIFVVLHIITSSTIINNGLNMTQSLYKKKNASNQVRLGATTSSNLNN